MSRDLTHSALSCQRRLAAITSAHPEYSKFGGSGPVRFVASVLAVAVVQMSLYAAMPQMSLAQPVVSPAGKKAALVIVPRRDEDREAATVLQSIFRQSLGKLVGVERASLSPVRNPEKAAQAAQAAQAGEAALNLDPALVPDFGTQAAGHFRRAAELMQGAPGAGDARLRAWIQKGLGVSLVATGERENAAAAMRRSILLVANQTGAEYSYTPAARDLFEAVQRDMAAESTGKLDVVSEPAGAEVYVAGELKGYTPMSVTNASAGEHYVELRADGYYVWGAFVEVKSGETATQDVKLSPAPSLQPIEAAKAGVQKKWQKASADEAARSIKVASGASDVILARVAINKSGQFEVDGFHSTGSGETVPVAVQLARDASLLSNIGQFLGGLFGTTVAPDAVAGPLSAPESRVPVDLGAGDDAVIDPNSPLFKKTGEDEEKVTDTWWFWTLIGVGVVGAALAITLPLTLGEEEKGGGPTGSLSIQMNGLGQ